MTARDELREAFKSQDDATFGATCRRLLPGFFKEHDELARWKADALRPLDIDAAVKPLPKKGARA